MKFRDGEMGKVGSKFVDSGFDFLELGGGWRCGIVYKGRSIGDRRQILGGHGLVVAGEGFIRRKRILTVISRWIVRRPLLPGPWRTDLGPWFIREVGE
jgi:hypothetical protein